MQISASVCLHGSQYNSSSSMHYGEYLGFQMYFAKDLASVNYYYDFNSKDKYSSDNLDTELEAAPDLRLPSLADLKLEDNFSSAESEIKPQQLLSTNKIESIEAEARDRKACAIFYI